MIGLTLATVVLTVYRPVAWSDDEMRFAVAAPAAVGILLALTGIALGRAEDNIVVGPVQFTAVQMGFALVLVGLLAYAAFNVGGRLGVGPMAPAPDPDARGGPPPASPAPDGWVRLGWGLGLPAVWLAGCLLVIPLVVYVITYVPWALIENHRIIDGWPVGHTGETLLDLTKRMYEYHNNLTAAHAASSPWWAWPLNLKPVWFYQGSYADVHGRRHLRRRQHGDLVAGHPGDGVRGLPGIPAPQPRPRADRDRVPGPVGLVGAHRPRGLPVPLLHEPAVRRAGAGLLRRRDLARGVAPDLAPGQGVRGRR